MRNLISVNMRVDQDKIVAEAFNTSINLTQDEPVPEYRKVIMNDTLTISAASGQRGFYIRQPVKNYSLLENIDEVIDRTVKESGDTNITRVTLEIIEKVF